MNFVLLLICWLLTLSPSGRGAPDTRPSMGPARSFVATDKHDKKIIPPQPVLPVLLPASIKVKAHSLVRLKADSKSDVTWDVAPEFAAPAEYEVLGDNRIILPPKPGKWVVRAWAVVDGKPTPSNRCIVEVEGGPVPPPVPPGPVPVPDWKRDLEAAYKADLAAGNADAAGGLVIGLAKQYAPLTSDYAESFEPKTVSDVAKRGQLFSDGYVVTIGGKLPKTSASAKVAFKELLPAPETALGDANRDEVAGICEQLAKSLTDLARGPPVPPEPPPAPSPIPVAGLHVLIVEETQDRTKLPANIQDVMFSEQLRTWMRNNNVKFRMLDQHQKLPPGEEADTWGKALLRPRDKLPWLVISNHPKGGKEMALPKTVGEVIDEIERLK